MAETKIKCTSCGKDKKLADFYSSDSVIHKYYKKIPVCKPCLFSIVDSYEINSVMNTLRMLDKPFLPDLWQSSIEEAETHDRDPFRSYMKNVNMRQYKGMNWNDSVLDSDRFDEIQSQSINLDSEAIDRWRGWKPEDMKQLEKNYQELIAAYEHDTPIQRNIYKNIAVAQLQADDAIARNSTGDYQRLMKVISDLMNDAKIKPLQDTGDSDGGLSTWGQWVAKIEEEEPIPEASEEFKDVDGIREYVDRWFVGHMKRILGIGDDGGTEKSDT